MSLSLHSFEVEFPETFLQVTLYNLNPIGVCNLTLHTFCQEHHIVPLLQTCLHRKQISGHPGYQEYILESQLGNSSVVDQIQVHTAFLDYSQS